MKQKPSDLGRARGEIQIKESVAKAMTKVDGVPKATSGFHVGKIGTQLYGRSHIGKDSQELVCHLSRHTEEHGSRIAEGHRKNNLIRDHSSMALCPVSSLRL